MSNKSQCCLAVKTNGSLCNNDCPNWLMTLPLHIRKNCTIIPTTKTLQDPLNIMGGHKKEILRQSKTQILTPSNLISKNVSISPIKNKENDDVLSKLKKMSGISFDLVKPKPIYKRPEVFRKPIKMNPKTIIESEVIMNKKVLSKKQNSDNVFKKYTNNKENENIQRINNIKTIKPKTLKSKNRSTSKSRNKLLIGSSIVSQVAKKNISNNSITNETTIKSSILNNTVIKTNDSTKENYTLMDLSINGQINIVQASPLDFNDIPNYNSEMEVIIID